MAHVSHRRKGSQGSFQIGPGGYILTLFKIGHTGVASDQFCLLAISNLLEKSESLLVVGSGFLHFVLFAQNQAQVGKRHRRAAAIADLLSDGPIGVLIEGVMESVAHWYSHNLATEVAKGKKERGNQGLHNNQAPFGMKKNAEKVLIPHEEDLPGLKLAFETYAKGRHSDADIARLLNEKGYTSITGRSFSKDTVRDILQNRTYLGKIKYQKYSRRSNGKRDFSAPVQWFEGQHEAVILEELFERCQKVRAGRRMHRQATPKYNHYLLRNLVYCYRCCSAPPEGKMHKSYGKMRPQAQRQGLRRYYRCRARELGCECDQQAVSVEKIDAQVVNILMNLTPPEDWRRGITSAMAELLGEQDLDERLEELGNKIQRMDVRWDNGFIHNEQEFIEQRLKLQMEIEQLTPVSDQDFQNAVDTLREFPKHWKRLEGKEEAQHDLIKLIVERVYVKDDTVTAVTLRSNYHLVLGHDVKEPTEVPVGSVYTCGSDGDRTRGHYRTIQFLAIGSLFR